MSWLLWYAIGLSCGIAIGYEELERRVRNKNKNKIRELFQKKHIKCIDENGNEIPCENIVNFIFDKKD